MPRCPDARSRISRSLCSSSVSSQVGSISWLAPAIESLGKYLDPNGLTIRRIEAALAHPLVIDKARTALLRAIGAATAQDFGDNLWRYVTWAEGRPQTRLAAGP